MLRLGLISDTHIPYRWREAPQILGTVFADVDLILHAGDVGELWVLDELSKIAPVAAVHGNDDSADATRELPYQQVLTIAGRRILLWHSHYPDRAEELASREDDSWERILQRQVERAQRAGAEVAVYGHTHIFVKAISPLAHACWAGERECITVEAFRREALEGKGLAVADRMLLHKLLQQE